MDNYPHPSLYFQPPASSPSPSSFPCLKHTLWMFGYGSCVSSRQGVGCIYLCDGCMVCIHIFINRILGGSADHLDVLDLLTLGDELLCPYHWSTQSCTHCFTGCSAGMKPEDLRVRVWEKESSHMCERIFMIASSLFMSLRSCIDVDINDPNVCLRVCLLVHVCIHASVQVFDVDHRSIEL